MFYVDRLEQELYEPAQFTTDSTGTILVDVVR